MTYFDNAATTFYKPEPVQKAVVSAMKFLSANPGRSGHALSIKAAQLVHKTRAKTAEFVGLARGNIIFCLNCTQALNYAILGSVREGGHVITTVLEHNSVLRPLFELQRAGRIGLTVLPPDKSGAVSASSVQKALTADTYLVATNHVSNVTGAVAPIKEIGALCRKYGILYLVDAAQSCGYAHVSMDGDNIDLLALAPHKGLHAPQGLGVLAVRENVPLSPVLFGGTGTDSTSVYQPRELPEAFESGTLPTPAIAGLNASLSWTRKHMADAHERLSVLGEYLTAHLQKIHGITLYSAPDSSPGIVSFNIGDLHSADVANILSEQYDIALRGGLHCAPLIHKHLGTLDQGIVRASLGIDTTYAEVDFLLRAVREVSGA
ncbi:MAG: aminotransferase class V-fold PLP-dependent enzyme [Firmicutes bacterium]|nr:aminotransferase class V-fold PLP-dependent enzyme [Bacillota bacterium]